MEAGPAPVERLWGEANGRVPGVGAEAAAGAEVEGSIASTERRGNNVILWTDQLGENPSAENCVCVATTTVTSAHAGCGSNPGGAS